MLSKCYERLGEFWTSENGQATILVCLSMTVLIGFLGLAIDVGYLRYSRNNLQVAADAAALAGALEVKQCAGTPLCSAMLAATQTSLTENNLNGATTVTNCAGTSVSGLELQIDNGPCAMGTGDPNTGKVDHVEVILTQPVNTYFARIFGFNTMTLTARSEASRSPGTNCIFALDPSGGNAITVDALASLSGHCGMVNESSAWNALSCNIIASINMLQIGVVGGVENFLFCGTSPTPQTGIALPSPADPLAYLPKPTVPACGTTTSSPFHGSPAALVIAGTATLYPDGAYCGGILIAPTANVTFMPGTFALTSRTILGVAATGGMMIDCGATVNGTGVTFYNYGPVGNIMFTATSLLGLGTNLTAPTSGTYGGILFYQDPQNTSPATIIGTTLWNTRIEGAYYFPTAKVIYAASGVANYNILVAYDIDFAVLSFGTTQAKASAFANDYSTLVNGSPVAGGGAVLVQ